MSENVQKFMSIVPSERLEGPADMSLQINTHILFPTAHLRRLESHGQRPNHTLPPLLVPSPSGQRFC